MTPNKQHIKQFFEGEKQYTIPVYQRAYSWDESQWATFLEDLNEATKGGNHYFFGNVLLEKLENSPTNDIIDGQQRISTIIIFVRALVNVLETRKKQEKFDKEKENDEFIRYVIEDYLINRGKAKLRVVDYDADYFNDMIIKNDEKKHKPTTPSQERIKNAKSYFQKALEKLETAKILAIFKAMQEAEILSIPFANKKDSVLMFELQNNRGKNLTNMEKLKSYLAYQIYTYCGDEAENKLGEITKIFEEIYRVINDTNKTIDEDSILLWFNMSFSKFGFRYRENDNDLNYKKELKEIESDKDEKIAWIDNYVKELKNAFFDFRQFSNSNDPYVKFLQILNVWEVYPFIIKAYRLFRNDENTLGKIFKSLEIIAFRDKLVKTRADLATRLNDILRNFDDVKSLVGGLKELCSGEEGEWWKYWRDEAVYDALIAIYAENKGILPYLFMRYENYLRSENAKTKGYPFKIDDIKQPEIEHIAPQTETIKESGKKKASGYCEYDKDFLDSYLNCVGNLVLISKSHNCSIGNEPFNKKVEDYKLIKQQEEIKSFASGNIWDKDAIDKRHEKIKNFVLETWSFDKFES